MAQKSNWSANAKQKKFMEEIAKEENGLSLHEVNERLGLTGTEDEIKSGSINCLITKGLVEAEGEREIEVTVKRKVKVYKYIG